MDNTDNRKKNPDNLHGILVKVTGDKVEELEDEITKMIRKVQKPKGN